MYMYCLEDLSIKINLGFDLIYLEESNIILGQEARFFYKENNFAIGAVNQYHYTQFTVYADYR